MPDFYDDMYEAGFDDPAEYMDYIESESLREDYYEGAYYEEPEYELPQFAFQEHVDYPRFHELEKAYLAWKERDPRGELFDGKVVKYSETMSFLRDEDEFEALLKRLESWKFWLTLSSDNETKYHTPQVESLLCEVDSMLRTKAICLLIREFCICSRDHVADLEIYKIIANWFNSNPSYYQRLVSETDTAKTPSTADTSVANAIIWSNHFFKECDLYSLFKCNEGVSNDEWEECFNHFINDGGVSRKVFDAWRNDNRLTWEDYLQKDDTQVFLHAIHEDLEANGGDYWWFGVSLFDEEPSQFSGFTVWEEDSADDYIDQRLFYRWRDIHLEEWKCWAEKYLWEKDLGHFRSNYTSKYPYMPYQWVDQMIIDASFSWIDSHREEWELYIQQIEYNKLIEVINQISGVYSFSLYYYKQLDSNDLLLQLGDYMRLASSKWEMGEQVYTQYEKEGALNDDTQYRDEEWWSFVEETKESSPNASFSEILSAWNKHDGLLSDYLNRCIYLHWLTVLAKAGKIDSELQFENVSGLY